MIEINPNIIIILNISSLATPIKRQKLSKWIKKNQGTTICCHQKSHLKKKKKAIFKYDMGGLKVKGWEKMYHANTNQKKPEAAIVISDKLTSEQRKLPGIKKNIEKQ